MKTKLTKRLDTEPGVYYNSFALNKESDKNEREFTPKLS